jgi:hypothetical protein
MHVPTTTYPRIELLKIQPISQTVDLPCYSRHSMRRRILRIVGLAGTDGFVGVSYGN